MNDLRAIHEHNCIFRVICIVEQEFLECVRRQDQTSLIYAASLAACPRISIETRLLLAQIYNRHAIFQVSKGTSPNSRQEELHGLVLGQFLLLGASIDYMPRELHLRWCELFEMAIGPFYGGIGKRMPLLLKQLKKYNISVYRLEAAVARIMKRRTGVPKKAVTAVIKKLCSSKAIVPSFALLQDLTHLNVIFSSIVYVQHESWAWIGGEIANVRHRAKKAVEHMGLPKDIACILVEYI